MPKLPLLLFAATLILPAPLAAQTSLAAQGMRQADHGAIDAAVEAFTGAATGTPGGARSPVDRRLRLAECPAPLALDWYGRGREMVSVECTQGAPWRIFVPLLDGGRTAAAAMPSAPHLASARVARGQVLTLTLQGRGFSISQQGEALEAGHVGDWIRVRPEGNREAVRARIDTPGRATIPLS